MNAPRCINWRLSGNPCPCALCEADALRSRITVLESTLRRRRSRPRRADGKGRPLGVARRCELGVGACTGGADVSADIRVPPDVLWTLLLCTVRYATGRSSYITGETADLVRQYRRHLGPERVEQIAREVETEFARCERHGGWLGMEMDHHEWRRLVNDLKGGA
jgi:hypothetical protein